MAIARVIYFSAGGIELKRDSIPNKRFEQLFPGVKGKRDDGYHMLVGWPPNTSWNRDYIGALPVDRVIEYKRNPSLHKCDARCQNATGKVCECSCKGKNHGAGNVL